MCEGHLAFFEGVGGGGGKLAMHDCLEHSVIVSDVSVYHAQCFCRQTTTARTPSVPSICLLFLGVQPSVYVPFSWCTIVQYMYSSYLFGAVKLGLFLVFAAQDLPAVLCCISLTHDFPLFSPACRPPTRCWALTRRALNHRMVPAKCLPAAWL